MEIISTIILSISGLFLLFVGIMRLSNPIKTYAKSSGIELTKDVNLLNEVRGISALMLCGGFLTALGTVVSELTYTSFVVAALIYLGFAIGRLLSISIDGKPNKQITQGIGFEIVLGAANVYGLLSL